VSGIGLPTGQDGYRLLACDIDDTLVRFPDPPSPRATAAVQAAVDAGIAVVLVTGRAFRRAQPIARALGLTTPIICNHGGSIRSAVDGQTIHRQTLPRPLTQEIVAWLQPQDVRLLLFDGDVVHHDCLADEIVADFRVYTGGEHSRFHRDLRTNVPERCDVVLITSQRHEHLAELYGRAQARWGEQARVLFSHPYGVDIMPHVLKSDALAWLAGSMGIAREAVMAVGDGDNDADMLAWAGLGVAMGDGRPGAHAAADLIAPSFDQDGLAWAIEQVLL
jgi:Cof subfamily protein (haloacid dehalogenase superfamily)